VVPDFDYLVAKGINGKDPRGLFDKLTLQMNKVSDENLKQDLSPLFVNRTYIENWLKNWRESYLRLLNDYEINTLIKLETVAIRQEFSSDTYFLTYTYKTEEGGTADITYVLSDYWIKFREGDLLIVIDNEVSDKIKFEDGSMDKLPAPRQKKLKAYATLFYQKTEEYLKKTNGVILGDTIATKAIRMTADNLNQKEQVVLNKSALLSCELDDLLK
jgi:hypothetical protein